MFQEGVTIYNTSNLLLDFPSASGHSSFKPSTPRPPNHIVSNYAPTQFFPTLRAAFDMPLFISLLYI